MDVTMFSFKKKLLKTMAATNTPSPPPPPPKKNPNVEVRLDHFLSWVNNFDQVGAKGGAIAKSAG